MKTAEGWAALADAAYHPGYGDGWRPKVQIFHGTEDEVVDYANYGEAVKQWTAVLGLGAEPVNTTLDTPVAGWIKSVYGEESGWFEAYSAAGVTHNIQNQEALWSGSIWLVRVMTVSNGEMAVRDKYLWGPVVRCT